MSPHTQMLALTSAQRRFLRARAHGLAPVVLLGAAGLSEAVLREIDANLKAHELIKIKVAGEDRDMRAHLLETICQTLNAQAVQHIGKILVIYRPATKPRLALPA
ncbi:ribosome assembly RNA-binding protein YhbY [Thiobacter aerophilum]|uniref:Ribosome assembly RNA-binding protein YhbY n=1 Tax=Thiobacter aerophilum TaxID=3121275 RepID=A0ABV0EGY5_9BURK